MGLGYTHRFVLVFAENYAERIYALQINTRGAEVLYNTIREVAEVSPITTLLDVCCGTGQSGSGSPSLGL